MLCEIFKPVEVPLLHPDRTCEPLRPPPPSKKKKHETQFTMLVVTKPQAKTPHPFQGVSLHVRPGISTQSLANPLARQAPRTLQALSPELNP